MSTILWINVPLMVLFLGAWAGIPLWFVLRRQDWHHKPEARTVPAYIVRQRREAMARRQRPSRVQRPVRPLTDW
jgi:hypothetical protein